MASGLVCLNVEIGEQLLAGGQTLSDQEAVKQFIDQVRWLYEPEYGDFKRKIGLYVQRLEEAHPALKDGHGKQVLSEIRTVVIYNPNGDIEATRRQILKMAHELLLGSPSGPLH